MKLRLYNVVPSLDSNCEYQEADFRIYFTATESQDYVVVEKAGKGGKDN